MAATQAAVQVKKEFAYRGGTKVFTNKYYLDHTTGPASGGAWDTLMDAIVADEAPVYYSNVTITECVGFTGGSDLPVHTKTYSQAGTGSFSSPEGVPGDCAAMIRYSTTQRTSKNHPIYLFNWYHGVVRSLSYTQDEVHPDQKTALEEYGTDWLAGFSDGTVTYIKAGPRGAVAQSRFVDPMIRHRDFRN